MDPDDDNDGVPDELDDDDDGNGVADVDQTKDTDGDGLPGMNNKLYASLLSKYRGNSEEPPALIPHSFKDLYRTTNVKAGRKMSHSLGGFIKRNSC